MAEPHRLPLGELKEDVAGLAADLREMLELRAKLAQQELLADAGNVRRLARAAAVATGMGIVAVPLLVVVLAHWLEKWLGAAAFGWLLAAGILLLGAAAILAGLAWRRFRRDLVALSGTLEELREDLVWLREWTEKRS
jgi:hypothetical protein